MPHKKMEGLTKTEKQFSGQTFIKIQYGEWPVCLGHLHLFPRYFLVSGGKIDLPHF